MKKRIVASLLALAMVLGLVGCGNTANANKGSTTTEVSGETEDVVIGNITYKKALDMTTDKITLTYFHFDQDETVKYLAKRFQEIYPNITVNAVKYQGDDYGGALLTLANNNQMPDVFMFYDCDYALSNKLLTDISGFYNTDPETQNLADTVNEAGLGCYGTSARFAVPVKFFPGIMFVDNNVLETLNKEAPGQDWTWKDMIDLIKGCTDYKNANGIYYGLGYYNRLDSYYGIASSQSVVGEFGFDGEDFDLSAWAIGEQEFADLKQAGYVAPRQNTVDMEQWMGDITTWEGSTGHVAMFSEAFWTYQNLWATEAYKELNLDIVPYVIPAVSDADASADHHSIATIDFGGVSNKCIYKREAYELLKFMSFGIDGWMTKIEAYNDTTLISSANNQPLKNDSMPVPITKDEAVWDAYIDMYCADMDEEHKTLWENYFASCMQPIPFGWTAIAGYWNYCDGYFNKLAIHDKVDAGTAKAADYVEEATIKANWYHADAMLRYFGPEGNGYDVLSEEEIAKYEKMKAENGGENGGGTGEETTEATE